MSWEYRVFEIGSTEWSHCQIHEVYYDEEKERLNQEFKNL